MSADSLSHAAAEPEIGAPTLTALLDAWGMRLIRHFTRQLPHSAREHAELSAGYAAREDRQSIHAALASLQSEIDGMREENRELRTYGGMLSNCAFNLAQDLALTERQRHSLDESRRNWDAALERMHESRAAREATP